MDEHGSEFQFTGQWRLNIAFHIKYEVGFTLFFQLSINAVDDNVYLKFGNGLSEIIRVKSCQITINNTKGKW